MEERKPDIKKGILHRVQVLYVLFFIIGLMIVGKILYLQYGPKSGRLRSEGTTITYERVAMEADRGDILACDGRILATSVPEYEVRMDFAANGLVDSIFLRDVDSLAYCLSGNHLCPNGNSPDSPSPRMLCVTLLSGRFSPCPAF